MDRMVDWWMRNDRRMFFWINHKWHHRVLDWLMSRVTHLGGVTFTLSFSIFLIVVSPESWGRVGWHCLIALIASHIPVHFIKKAFPRRRPYLVYPDAYSCKNPLKDYSFPSGHTTAIFSITTVILLDVPSLGIMFLLPACMVAVSRIYLGQHFPSDVLIGSLIGITSAVLTTL